MCRTRVQKTDQETETSGSFWRSTVTDIDTRLRAARGLGKDETKASVEAFESLRRRGHPQAPPPIVSDGWGGITEAMIEVWGRIPPYRGRGRPPTRKLPGDNWQYLQMIKHRDKRGRLMEIEVKVVFGAEQDVRQLLGENTAYAERNYLTMRHFNGRLVRISTRKGIDSDQVALGQLRRRAVRFLLVALGLPGSIPFPSVIAHPRSPSVWVTETSCAEKGIIA
jgi:hypothetical protein